MNRLVLFIYRFQNQYKIHHRWASIWKIALMAWKQSGRNKVMTTRGKMIFQSAEQLGTLKCSGCTEFPKGVGCTNECEYVFEIKSEVKT